jgi:hypothetical protein
LSRPGTVINQADVIIGLELSDYWGTVNGFIDNDNDGVGKNVSKIKPGTKLISISSVELLTKSNYQDFQRFQSIDVSMPGDAQTTLPSLIEELRSAISNDRKDAMTKHGTQPRSVRRGWSPRPTPRSKTSIGRWCRPHSSAIGPIGSGQWRSTTIRWADPAVMAWATDQEPRSVRRSVIVISAASRSPFRVMAI